jgi:dethiobiotin synthetase
MNRGHAVHFPSALFVTGTDTGVGKTVVAASLVAGLDAVYWKPVQSGLLEPTDTETVRRLTGHAGASFLPETYRLTQPLSPHASAALDGVAIDLAAIRPPVVPEGRHLVVEGAGGVLVPLNDRFLMIDLIAALAMPVLVVARSTLGTINHTLLTLQALRGAGIEILGVVLNGPRHPGNRQAIEQYGQVAVLGEIETFAVLDGVDWRDVFTHVFGDRTEP